MTDPKSSNEGTLITDENITHAQYFEHQRQREKDIQKNTESVLELVYRFAGKGPVLDIGVGTGIGLRYMAQGLPAGTPICGLDTDSQMIAYAKKELAGQKNISLVQADASFPLPFPDEAFGLLHSEYTLHHLENPEMAVKEAYRLLKPGGLFILIDIDPQNWMSRLFSFGYPMLRFAGLGWPSGEAAYHSIQCSPPFYHLHKMLSDAGFEIAYSMRARIRQMVAAIKRV